MYPVLLAAINVTLMVEIIWRVTSSELAAAVPLRPFEDEANVNEVLPVCSVTRMEPSDWVTVLIVSYAEAPLSTTVTASTGV